MKQSLSITIMLLFVVSLAFPQATPTVMNYQGRLTDNDPGQTPIDASVPMEFAIYYSATTGTAVWSETWTSVDVVGGIFSVMLGSNGSPIDNSVFVGGVVVRYLEIIVDGETLSPRQKLGKVGYADQSFRSEDVGCVGCVDTTDILDGTVTVDDLRSNSVGALEIIDRSIGASDIATGAIGATQIATDGVGSLEIVDGSVRREEIAINAVGASQIDANAVGNSELDNTASITIGGLLTLDRNSGQKILTRRDGVAKLELWTDSAFSYLYHRPADSYLAVNDSTGNWGINTTGPTERLDIAGTTRVRGMLTADSHVDVAGTVFMGRERIIATGTTSATASTCTQGGVPWTCYQANVQAQCTPGKLLIGGGCNCSGLNDSVCYGYPVTDDGYRCYNAEDNAGQSFSAYAICARLSN